MQQTIKKNSKVEYCGRKGKVIRILVREYCNLIFVEFEDGLTGRIPASDKGLQLVNKAK